VPNPSDAIAQLATLIPLVIGAIALVALILCAAAVILRQGGRPPGWR
jgi:hypothetical protein